MIKKIKAQGVLEFTAVVVILFIFVVGVIDIALFFRQVYMTQTVSDQVLARLTNTAVCSGSHTVYSDEGSVEIDDSATILNIMNDSISYYFSVHVDFEKDSTPSDDYFSSYTAGNFKFTLSCKSDTVPNSIMLTRKYKGILFFTGGTSIKSNMSTNTTLL